MAINIKIEERAFEFGVRIVKMSYSLPRSPAGFALANQIIRSGTSIGANITEAQDASSRKEFAKYISIALREARETEYWLKIIVHSNVLPEFKLTLLLEEITEIVKILRSSIKKLKTKISN